MVNVAFLGVVAAFVATEYATVPGPLPVPPPVTVIQLGAPAVVQLQPCAVVTDTSAVPPSLPNARFAGAIVYEHTGDGWVGESPSLPHPALAANASARSARNIITFLVITYPYATHSKRNASVKRGPSLEYNGRATGRPPDFRRRHRANAHMPRTASTGGMS